MLTPEEFEFNKQRAEAGDSQAAFALYEYYEELGEDQEASKWLLASVSDGFANLDDLPEGTPVSGRERFWLQPAELNATLAAAEGRRREVRRGPTFTSHLPTTMTRY